MVIFLPPSRQPNAGLRDCCAMAIPTWSPSLEWPATNPERVPGDFHTVRVGIGVRLRGRHLSRPLAAVEALCKLLPCDLGSSGSDWVVATLLDPDVLVVVHLHRWRPGMGWPPSWAQKAARAPERWEVVDETHALFVRSDPRAKVVYRGARVDSCVGPTNLIPDTALDSGLPAWTYPDPGLLLRQKASFDLRQPRWHCKTTTCAALYMDRYDVLDVLIGVYEQRVYCSARRAWPYCVLDTWLGGYGVGLGAWAGVKVVWRRDNKGVVLSNVGDTGKSCKLFWQPFKSNAVQQACAWASAIESWTAHGAPSWIKSAAWTPDMAQSACKSAKDAGLVQTRLIPLPSLKPSAAAWPPPTPETCRKPTASASLPPATPTGSSTLSSGRPSRLVPLSTLTTARSPTPLAGKRATPRSKKASSFTIKTKSTARWPSTPRQSPLSLP